MLPFFPVPSPVTWGLAPGSRMESRYWRLILHVFSFLTNVGGAEERGRAEKQKEETRQEFSLFIY